MLDEGPPLRPVRLRIDVDALVRLPGAGEPAERPEIGETVGRDIVGLGEDVGGNGEHGNLVSLRGAAIAQGRRKSSGMEPEGYARATGGPAMKRESAGVIDDALGNGLRLLAPHICRPLTISPRSRCRFRWE